jgi:hypothetical protein
MTTRCLLLALGACGFQHGAALHDGGGPDADTSSSGPHTWTVDTAADFIPGETSDLGVDPSGALTPAGYFYGGLALHAIDGTQIWHAGDPAPTVDTHAAASGHALWSGAQMSSVANTDLSTAGVTGSMFSAWVVGELYLPAGAHTFSLTGGAIAFMEIAPAHSSTFTKLLTATGGATVTAPFTAPSDGWYQVRAGLTAAGSPWVFDLEDTPPSSAAPLHFGRNNMRAREEEGRGLMQAVYNHQLLTASGGRAPHQLSTDALASLALPLYGQSGNGGAFSARWSGQFYAAASGTYVLQLTTNCGNQLAAGGQAGASHFTRDDTTASTTMVSVTSTGPGWYDLAFDMNEPSNASPSLNLVVMSGPELVGQAIPIARLRAVETTGDRLVSSSTMAGALLADQGTVTEPLPELSAYYGETVTSLAVRATLFNPEYGTSGLSISLYDPAGQAVSLDANAYSLNSNVATYYWLVRGSMFTAPVIAPGNWSLRFTDLMSTSGNAGGSIYDAEITIHAAGGPSPIATDGTWMSPLVDAGQLASVDSVTWMERSTTMPAKVQLRACDVACTTETWITVTNGGTAAVGTGHRYLQARVELFSDGTTAPEFDQLVVHYTSK